ncbi:MAG: LytR family transcriptional regulator [Ruminococcaceae bacterium]|nr:LytR family transcriptional regulator [Oscillospiraceae bacterium]
MADNRFNNNDFEDIYSNTSKNDEFEDIFSNSSDEDFYEDVSSFSGKPARKQSEEFDEYYDGDFTVKYNSAVQNRRRQEIQYDDISDVYGDISSDTDSRKKKKKKSHPIRNAFLVFLCLVIVAVSCVGFYGYNTVDKLLSSFNTDEPLEENLYISSDELYSDADQINILLVGVDAREGDTDSRSDTMMLVTLDNKNGQIKLTSFLRDSYVEIAGRNRSSKLNSAYFRGGIQMLVDTLELNFGVEIPYYALVDFEIFTTIVDELGGINVDVTEKESYYTYHSGKVGVPVRIEAGEDVLLNGEQALWYSRIRYLDSDFMRTKRQRKVISAIVEKALTKEIPELLDLAEAVIPLVKTNLDSDKIMEIGIDAVMDKAWSYPIVQHQIPANKTWSSKTITGVGSCLVMDMEENRELFRSFLSEKQEVPEEESTTKAQ